MATPNHLSHSCTRFAKVASLPIPLHPSIEHTRIDARWTTLWNQQPHIALTLPDGIIIHDQVVADDTTLFPEGSNGNFEWAKEVFANQNSLWTGTLTNSN